MTAPRLFLVCPDGLPDETARACALAAAAAGDCACILMPSTTTAETAAALQATGMAVLLRDCEPRMVHRLKADGLVLSSADELAEARAALKSESLGFVAGISRHAAMEAAEAAVDFVAFTQKHQHSGEPIIGWWHDVTDVPSVALDPVSADGLATLLPQKPDFIVPDESMWKDAAMSASVISALAKVIAA